MVFYGFHSKRKAEEALKKWLSNRKKKKEKEYNTQSQGMSYGIGYEPEPKFTDFAPKKKPEPKFTDFAPKKKPEPKFTDFAPKKTKKEPISIPIKEPSGKGETWQSKLKKAGVSEEEINDETISDYKEVKEAGITDTTQQPQPMSVGAGQAKTLTEVAQETGGGSKVSSVASRPSWVEWLKTNYSPEKMKDRRENPEKYGLPNRTDQEVIKDFAIDFIISAGIMLGVGALGAVAEPAIAGAAARSSGYIDDAAAYIDDVFAKIKIDKAGKFGSRRASANAVKNSIPESIRKTSRVLDIDEDTVIKVVNDKLDDITVKPEVIRGAGGEIKINTNKNFDYDKFARVLEKSLKGGKKAFSWKDFAKRSAKKLPKWAGWAAGANIIWLYFVSDNINTNANMYVSNALDDIQFNGANPNDFIEGLETQEKAIEAGKTFEDFSTTYNPLAYAFKSVIIPGNEAAREAYQEKADRIRELAKATPESEEKEAQQSDWVKERNEQLAKEREQELAQRAEDKAYYAEIAEEALKRAAAEREAELEHAEEMSEFYEKVAERRRQQELEWRKQDEEYWQKVQEEREKEFEEQKKYWDEQAPSNLGFGLL